MVINDVYLQKRKFFGRSIEISFYKNFINKYPRATSVLVGVPRLFTFQQQF